MWTLSEIVRIKSNLSTDATQKLVSSIVERQIPILWKDGDVKRILDSSMKTKDQVLVLLYDKSPSSESELREAIEYRNVSDFRQKVIKQLHSKRLIDFHEQTKMCRILPQGMAEAEKAILSKKK